MYYVMFEIGERPNDKLSEHQFYHTEADTPEEALQKLKHYLNQQEEDKEYWLTDELLMDTWAIFLQSAAPIDTPFSKEVDTRWMVPQVDYID